MYKPRIRSFGVERIATQARACVSQFTLIAGRSGVAARLRCLRVEKSYRRLLRPRGKRPYSRASVLGPISQFLAREGLQPIDAKFPHDSFERVVAAGGRKSG